MRHLIVAVALLTIAVSAQVSYAQGDHTPDGPSHIRCGTPVWWAAHAGGSSDKERGLLSSLACDSRVVKSNSVVSRDGHFRIHYDVTGPDAVDPRDANANDVPDYIDSVDFYMEMAWQVEVGEYEFSMPPADGGGPGPEIDVYICELSASYYGYAIPEPGHPTGANTVSGFLVLDNDYAGYPTSGINGLRVTSAHEFNHIIQFASYRYDLSQASIYEATSVWFEKKVHPAILDYRQYTDSLILRPHTYGFSTNNTSTVTGYAHVLYLDYLEKRYDRDVVRGIWEEFRTKETEWESIDGALRDRGGNLATSYCEFGEWAYRTGDRADTSFFSEAKDYPTMRALLTAPYEGSTLTLPGSLYPLSFALYRVAIPRTGSILSDTVDLLVTNARTDFGKGNPALPRDRFAIEISSNNGGDRRPLRGPGDSIYYRIDDATGGICSQILVDGQPIFYLAARPSPQPFVADGAERLVVPIPDVEVIGTATMWIYSAAMRPVATVAQSGLASANNLLGVVWDGRGFDGSLVNSGVYLYEIEIDGSTYAVGKIAVARR